MEGLRERDSEREQSARALRKEQERDERVQSWSEHSQTSYVRIFSIEMVTEDRDLDEKGGDGLADRRARSIVSILSAA
jgi:hypothetical protein